MTELLNLLPADAANHDDDGYDAIDQNKFSTAINTSKQVGVHYQ